MCWWAGPLSDLLSVLSSPLGSQSNWFVPYLPFSQGQDSLWSSVPPIWAACTLPGLWCCFYGIWCISRGGSARCTRVGGAGLGCFAVGGPLWKGPCSTGREAGRPIRGMDPQKHSSGCLHSASKFCDGNWFPLGFWLGDGRGRWHWQVPLLPTKLSSVVWGSTTLPPIVLQPSRSQSKAVDL